jgi:hypothetical protein
MRKPTPRRDPAARPRFVSAPFAFRPLAVLGVALLAPVVACGGGHSPTGASSSALSADGLTISSPAKGTQVSGKATVTGSAPGFVNVEVWDATHHSPPLGRATPAADGTFSLTVDTTALPTGSDAWTVWAWNSPAGQPASEDAEVPLDVTIVRAPAYTLAVTSPSKGATVDGTVTVTGTAPGFVNVEVWDAKHQSPPLGRATAAADGAFSLTVDTAALATGSDAWTVWAWDSAAGKPASHQADVPLPVTIARAVAPYTLVIDSPSSGATVDGTVTVKGVATSFVNVEVRDAAHQSPPLARTTAGADGSFSATVDTTKLANGSDAWTVWAWDSPAGKPAAHQADKPLPVTIANSGGTTPPSGDLPYAIGLLSGELSHVESELGRPTDIIQTYNWRGSWDSWTSVSGPITDDSGSVIAHPMALSVGLITDTGSDLATAAAGGYDAYYQQFARNLGAAGNIPGTSIPAVAAVRIGWEMNGNWFAWSIEDASSQIDPTLAKNYVAAFRRLAGFIHKYAPNVLIDWCPNNGGADPTSSYPGDDVVDIVGMDLYEQNWGSFSRALGNPGEFLLDWLDTFASGTWGVNAPAGKTGGKKLISLPEWQASANDGAFITQMAAWMNARGNQMSYMAYWDSDVAVAPGGTLSENAAVNAAFVAAWKGTKFGGTIPLTIAAGF